MNTTIAHPFELAGLGTGPYQFVGTWTFPYLALAEHNPTAYQAALQTMPRDLMGGGGTCANCGMAISNVCIVKDGQGRRYGVGTVWRATSCGTLRCREDRCS